jgi:hypothetical protein
MAGGTARAAIRSLFEMVAIRRARLGPRRTFSVSIQDGNSDGGFARTCTAFAESRPAHRGEAVRAINEPKGFGAGPANRMG